MTESSITEVIVGNHLRAFLEQKGVAAIVSDYDDEARFLTEAKVYHGKQEIYDFFVDFIGSLPSGGIDRFALRSMQVDGNIAYITWNIGEEIHLGTDTFVVDHGKIISQTFAMYPTSR
jgi:ketosteroid isomerase-like protein